LAHEHAGSGSPGAKEESGSEAFALSCPRRRPSRRGRGGPETAARKHHTGEQQEGEREAPGNV